MIVAVAGLDGVGKTTLVDECVRRLIHRGYEAEVAKFALFQSAAVRSYEEPLAHIRRLDPKAAMPLETAIVALETYRFVTHRVIPASRHSIVVCDRYIEGPLTWLLARHGDVGLFEAVSHRLPPPSIGFLLDAPLEVIIGRLEAAHGSPVTADQVADMRTVLRHLRSVATASGYVTIDAQRPVSEYCEELVAHIVASPDAPLTSQA